MFRIFISFGEVNSTEIFEEIGSFGLIDAGRMIIFGTLLLMLLEVSSADESQVGDLIGDILFKASCHVT